MGRLWVAAKYSCDRVNGNLWSANMSTVHVLLNAFYFLHRGFVAGLFISVEIKCMCVVRCGET